VDGSVSVVFWVDVVPVRNLCLVCGLHGRLLPRYRRRP
jgi:hypothetical protein